MLTVGFVGLPSAGKSTLINALAGRRVLQSGVCRTTTEACLVGRNNTVSFFLGVCVCGSFFCGVFFFGFVFSFVVVCVTRG